MSPLYVYRCRECGREAEELRPTSDRAAAADCEECGRGMADPIMTSPGSVRFGVPGVKGHYTTEAGGGGTRC